MAIVDAVNCLNEDLSPFGPKMSRWDPNLGGTECTGTSADVCQATQSGIPKRTGSVQFTLNSVVTTVFKP